MSQHKKVIAIDSVSLELQPATVTALVGPNGAGKSTLINMICGLVSPDQGEVNVCDCGSPLISSEARRRIGLVTTNDRSFFWRLTGRQNLLFFGKLYGLIGRDAEYRVERLLETFKLNTIADRLFYTYSSGMKKRFGLARSLLHDPRLLLFDEPTTNLDASATDELMSLICTELIGSGKSILWATHLLDEMVRVCDSVLLLLNGRLHLCSSVSDFVDLCACHSGISVHFSFSPDRRAEIIPLVNEVADHSQINQTTAIIYLSANTYSSKVTALLAELARRGAAVTTVQPQNSSLKSLFEHFTMNPSQLQRNSAT
jgi:ABC-2 type transport system ATP-binding protein